MARFRKEADMARRARPWYRSSRGAWFVQLDGKQHNLGITDPNDLAGALEALRRLLLSPNDRGASPNGTGRSPNEGENPVAGWSPTVPEAARRYLADLKARADAGKVTRGHYRNCRIVLDQFARAFPDVQVSRLTADRVERWAESRPWSPSYQNDAIGVVGALLRAEGVTLRLRKPPKESRGAAVALTDEQFRKLVHDLTAPRPGRKAGDLAQLLHLLRETGARPGEVCGLTVEAVDWPNALARLAKHKTRRHTGRDRVIHFNAAAVAILEAQRARYGAGILFRTRHGNAYKPNELWEVLGAAGKRLGFRVVAYGQRHAFATSALAAGVPDAIVAELLGTGVKMIEAHYGHLGQRAGELKRAAELASRKAAG